MIHFRSKIFSLALVGATTASLLAPVTANAALSGTAPTVAKAADSNISKVGAHRAAETLPLMLGAELTTMQTNVTTLEAAQTNAALNVFGSDWNESPSVYLWNYYYNLNTSAPNWQEASPALTRLTATVPPMGADSSGTTVSTNPDIYLGIAATNGYTYPDTATKGVAYGCNNLNDLIDTAYNLAYKMNSVKSGNELTATPASGRYGNPVNIARKYEEYVKATKYYVLSQLGSTAQKKIAIVGAADSSGNYKLYTTADSTGTAYTCRAAEFLDGTTENIASDLGSTATAAQLKDSGVDYIFTVGFQGGTTTESALRTADAVPDDAIVIDELPTTTYGIIMNSAENAFGVGLFQSIVYPEYFDVDSNHNNGNEANAAVAYFYKNFYHLTDSAIPTVAEALKSSDFPVKFEEKTASFSYNLYADKLEDGLDYYDLTPSLADNENLALSTNHDRQ